MASSFARWSERSDAILRSSDVANFASMGRRAAESTRRPHQGERRGGRGGVGKGSSE